MRHTTVYGSGKVFFVMFSRCQYFIIFNKVDDTLYNTFVLLFQKSAIEFLRAPQEKSKTKQKQNKKNSRYYETNSRKISAHNGKWQKIVAPWCSGHYYCTTSFN